MNKAYLIVICDPVTNAIIRVEIWSCPEWDQTLCLTDAVTYVAYMLAGRSYADARARLVELLRDPGFRYHYLCEHLSEEP